MPAALRWLNSASTGRPSAVDASAPYQSYWNTGALANGTNHTVTAVATDGTGNTTTSAPVTVTIANPTDAASIGAWSAPFELGFVAVEHGPAQHRQGPDVSGLGGQRAGRRRLQPGQRDADVNPAITTSNIFCSGHATLADGRVLRRSAAGTAPTASSGCSTRTSSTRRRRRGRRLPDMAYRRWYPTRHDAAGRPRPGDLGRDHLRDLHRRCAGGLQPGHEHVDAAHRPRAWRSRTIRSRSCCRTARCSTPARPTPPRSGANAGRRDADLDRRWIRSAFDGSSAAMYLPGKVLQSGTASDPSFTLKPAVTATAVLDMTQASPAWRQTAPMAYPRAYNNLTILPDGSVLAVGGGTNTSGIDDSTKAVLAAERWSPATETWTTMASARARPAVPLDDACCCPTAACWSRAAATTRSATNQTQAGVTTRRRISSRARGPRSPAHPSLVALRHLVLRRHAERREHRLGRADPHRRRRRTRSTRTSATCRSRSRRPPAA